MEFHIRSDLQMPALDAITRAVQELDPSAQLGLFAVGRQLRVSTWLGRAQLADVFAANGWQVPPERIEQQPSVCCGGCGG